ncbi:creatininase family protein, partial [Bacillus paranthracis]|nr:creatininase family protein [Bacillus paranthracis]
MQLHLMSWPEVANYLSQRQDILIPIGSTEQHGPMGLIGTDAICPEAIANAAAAELGCIVGPTINVGMAQHHLAFPGTIALRPSTLIAYLQDYVNSLALAGLTHFYFF